MTFTEKRSPETLLNAESRDGEIYKCNIWINDMPPAPDAIGANCATPEWSPRVLYANHSHNTWSGSSQHCPKSRRDPRDDRLFHRLFTLANSDDGLCLESTLRSECRTESELRVEESMIPNFNSITIPNHH